MNAGRPSRTAVLVCQGRAAADGRLGVGSFADPVARQLLDEDERWLVDEARSDVLPTRLHERVAVESVRACAQLMVARTVAIDRAVCETVRGQQPGRQVVILGAGLDSRPWRLDCLRGHDVYLVDHEASLADAARRAAGLIPVTRLTRVAVDLSTARLDTVLEAAGHAQATPTTWLWEGVIPYLRRREVEATVAAIARRSSPGSVLVANYQQATLVTTWGRRLGRLLTWAARIDDPLAGEPWRSLWRPLEVAALLAAHGFRVDTDENLAVAAARLGLPARSPRSLESGRVLVAQAQLAAT